MSLNVNCLVVAGPSGVGKTTLIKGALERDPDWLFSVSATTRAKRENEVDGREYYFLERKEFEQRIASGGFLEYADVYGNIYGTPRTELDRAANAGKNLLIEVDTVGCLSIRALLPDIPLVAVLPPSMGELKRRLRDRGTETEETLAVRYANIVAELQRMRAFDFSIINNEIEEATSELLDLMKIISAGLYHAGRRVDRLLKGDGGTE
jgi:guanylate kinase